MARRMINYNNNSNNGTKTEERSAAAEDRRGRRGLKKGPWTAAEDAILLEYVKRHGEGNWNAVQKNAGLARCGKSCRLRWANHLRPNLKKGAFSPQEERIIIELHAKLGNKWARMASQLPGRTDNEIKNYWNTRMKRRQRAGLPLYPKELHQQLPQQVQENHQITQNSHSSSSNSFSSLLNSQNKLSICNDFSHHVINQLKHNICDDGNFDLPIYSHVSQLSPNVSHTIPITPTFQYNPGGTLGTFSSMLIEQPYDPVGRLMASVLPSNQTPAPSDGRGGDLGLMGRSEKSSTTSTAHDQCHYDLVFHESRLGKSGLLDDLLAESRVLSRSDREKRQNGMSYEEEEKGKSPALEESAEDDDDGVWSELVLKNSGETSTGGGGGGGDDENRTENFSTCDQPSIGVEPSENPLDVSSVDDDLMSLLNNFPTSMPVPNWYPGGGGNLFDKETSAATSGVVPQNASPTRVSKHDQSLKYSSYWNNMPSIC